jgi:hypothetical protein
VLSITGPALTPPRIAPVAKVGKKTSTFLHDPKVVAALAKTSPFHGLDPEGVAKLAKDFNDQTARRASMEKAVKSIFGSMRRRVEPSSAVPMPAVEAVGRKAWLANYVANTPGNGSSITEFSRQASRAMREDAKTNPNLRPMKPRSIENRLREYGLWPPPGKHAP